MLVDIIPQLLCLEFGVAGWRLSAIANVLAYQVMIIIIVTSGFAIMGGGQYAMSSVLGGLAAFIPNLYFAIRINKSDGQSARKVLNSFYIAESGKLLLTAALFIIIYQIPGIMILPLLAGYVTVLSVFWFALLMR